MDGKFLRFSQNEKVQAALKNLSKMPELEEIKKSLTLADLNKVLYCCDAEDGGVYNVPKFSPFVYCGLQGNHCSKIFRIIDYHNPHFSIFLRATL